jgi:CDP-diacylglycerol--glycerol-3-phosphate 3-phosphatidyltransferase
LLSASRIPGALLLLAVYSPDDTTRAWLSVGLVLIITITDWLDGWLARRHGITSKFGYLLDGLGDRAVHVVAYLLLFSAGVISIYLVWILIFRELSQYGVRTVEPGWHTSQSSGDRVVTRMYTVAVHGTLLAELLRCALAPGAPPFIYTLGVTVILCLAALASYFRILPRLVRTWRETTRG